ncbi:MAG: UDP-N-acetylmuramoyl-tripeptide--D-alanyl-D-alanine ligase [Ignavibacteriae bacterium]|nr:MAG: UDP-N-acetylmuramoyl-tripeptide--D-alanyl-D-alanine ligase [Ignavibacteriota bacterium]
MKIDFSDISKVNGKVINPAVIERKVFKNISIDSRTCKKGDIFFAIKGDKFDGHDFIGQVIKKGAGLVIADNKWYSANKKNYKNKNSFLIVNDTTGALGELAGVYRDKFVLPVIAIAGSNGKTTVKDVTAHVLSKKYNVLKTEGNLNNAIGVPLTLFRLNDEHQIAVIETGTNHFGEVAGLCRIVKPQFGLITNIGKEHLEFLSNINGAAKAEFELVDYLKKNYGTFFVNMDDVQIAKRTDIKKIKSFTFGQAENNDVKGKIKKFTGFSPEIEISYNRKKINALLKITGVQSFKAALCASATGLYFDVSFADVKKALEEFTSASAKRNEMICKDGITVIDDTYNSNPDSVKMALENLKHYKVRGRKHIVLGDMLELGKTSKREHENAGELVKKMGFESLYTYGEESYNTFKKARGVQSNFYFGDKYTLIEFLKLNLRKGDMVLVKGSRSMKMEEVVQEI